MIYGMVLMYFITNILISLVFLFMDFYKLNEKLTFKQYMQLLTRLPIMILIGNIYIVYRFIKEMY